MTGKGKSTCFDLIKKWMNVETFSSIMYLVVIVILTDLLLN